MPHNRFNPVHEINNQTRPVLFYPSLPNRPPLLSLQIRPIRWQHVATEASRGVTRLVPVFPLRLYDSLLFSLRAIPPFHASQPLRPNQQPDQSCQAFQPRLVNQCERVSVGVRIQGVPVSTLGALKERKERERMRGMVEAAAGAAAAAADLGKRGVAEAEVTAGETIKAETGGAATAGGGAAASAAAGVGGSGSAAEESTHVSPFLNLACPTSDPAAGSGQGGSGRGGSARSALDREMEQRLPIQLQRALLPFQREGVAFAVGRGGRCLIADEMGVGKTIQAIAAAAWYMAEGPLLIVCPACLRLQWAEQLERWLPFLRPSQIHIVFGQRDDLVEEDQGERAVGASTDGHLNELTDKAKSTGEAKLERQRDELAEVEKGERAVGASTDGHMNGHTDKAKTTGEANLERQRDEAMKLGEVNFHVLHNGRVVETNIDEKARHPGGGRALSLLLPHSPISTVLLLSPAFVAAPAVVITSFTMAGRAAETNADEEAREVGHGGGGRGTNLSLFPLTPLNLSQPLVSPSITAPAVVITSFTMAGRLRRTLMRRRGGWGMVVVDEAHVLRTARKPFDCLETRVVVDVIRRTKRAVLLTGTPSLSRPFDLFNLVDSLWPGLLGMSKYEYARNYCDRGRDSRDFSRGIRLRELHILLSHTVMCKLTCNYCDRGRDSRDFLRGIRLHELHILLSHTVMVRRGFPSPLPPPSPPLFHRGAFRRRGRTRPPRGFLPTRADATTAADSTDKGGRDHRGNFRRRGRTRPPRWIPPTRVDATTAADSTDEGERDHRGDSADEGGRDHRGGFHRQGRTRPPRRIPPTRADAITAAISANEGGRDHHGDFRRRGRMRPPQRIPPTRTDATTAADSADEGGRDHRGGLRR
ncbi:unnamed protein product [Closterium sp. NIES-53]